MRMMKLMPNRGMLVAIQDSVSKCEDTVSFWPAPGENVAFFREDIVFDPLRRLPDRIEVTYPNFFTVAHHQTVGTHYGWKLTENVRGTHNGVPGEPPLTLKAGTIVFTHISNVEVF